MATDKLEVLNNALTHLGESNVTTDAENSAVRKLDASMDVVRKRVLRTYPFPFARARVSMTTVAAVTPYLEQFNYTHTKPADWLRTIEVSYNGDFERGRIVSYGSEGGALHSDHDAAWIWYVKDHSTYTEWDALFDDLLALELAEHCCLQVTDSKSLTQMKQDDLKSLRASAWAISSSDLEQQERPPGNFRGSRYGSNRRSGYAQF